MSAQVLFIGEIQRQCKFALIACETIEKSLHIMGHETDKEKQLDRFWYSVQSFLVSVANISKILWPSTPCGLVLDPDVISSRIALRTLLSVDEDSILKSRSFRNHFEHFDSRIEEWAKKTKDRRVIDSNVLPSYLIAGYDPMSMMRNFDPSTYELTFRDRRYQFRLVVDAIKELFEKATSVSSSIESS
jgi:hypothetical protein